VARPAADEAAPSVGSWAVLPPAVAAAYFRAVPADVPAVVYGGPPALGAEVPAVVPVEVPAVLPGVVPAAGAAYCRDGWAAEVRPDADRPVAASRAERDRAAASRAAGRRTRALAPWPPAWPSFVGG
jgi:hypothetical protein